MDEHTRERFEAKVDRSGGPDACHLWTGGTGSGGYGRFRVGASVWCTHVLSLAEQLGRALAPGKWALHTCDNRPCCNPAHLYEGTRAQNTADRIARERTARGEECGTAKLNESAVLDIRREEATKASYARRYGVSEREVGRVQTREAWAHVPEARSAEGP